MEKKEIPYKFTAVPTNLMIACDSNCKCLLFTMCQLSSMFADENGRFFRTNSDLSAESSLSEKLVRACIDSLYSNQIIEVWSVGQKKGKIANYFRLNVDKIKEYEKFTLEELKNPQLQICTVKDYNKKGYSPSYLKKNSSNDAPENPPIISQDAHYIDNIKSIDNIENNNIINNKIRDKGNIEIIDDTNDFETVITSMLQKNYSIPQILTELAQTDNNYYSQFKVFLKENSNLKDSYFKYRDLIEDLNIRYMT